jgi:4-hydroxy-tetrahydrodipicolinate reductase
VKIALIGYGKMGKVIEDIALERGHEVVARFNSQDPANVAALRTADIAIEFTRPELALVHLDKCLEAGCPVVIGTTGWYDAFETVKANYLRQNGSMLYATNFSLGVNITFIVNEFLAKIMASQTDYACGITEIHHTKKLDAPSGTAITLAEAILNNNHAFSGWVLDEALQTKGTLPIHAIREGDVPGTHTVTYKSDIDTISITHEAHNRKGFALGSVIAAEWLLNKNGVFSMKDMLNFGN